MVLVDDIYQRVLTLVNKEQRGYITPQEFNIYANQAQMDIFDQYFYDLNQFRRLPGNNTEYADMVDILEEKINIFKQGPLPLDSGDTLTDVYKLTDLKPSTHRPVYWRKDGKIYWSPNEGSISAHWIRKPAKVNWAYEDAGGSAQYDVSNSSDFELHASEETKLVVKILQLAGITLKDPSLYQIGAAEDNKNIQQEKS